MYSVFVFIHIIICIGLILVVLFQAGKGAGLGNLLRRRRRGPAFFRSVGERRLLRK